MLLASLPVDVLRDVAAHLLEAPMVGEPYVDCHMLARCCRATAIACRRLLPDCRAAQLRHCSSLTALAVQRLLDAVMGDDHWTLRATVPLEPNETVKQWRLRTSSRHFFASHRLPCVELTLRGAGGHRDSVALVVRFVVHFTSSAHVTGGAVLEMRAFVRHASRDLGWHLQQRCPGIVWQTTSGDSGATFRHSWMVDYAQFLRTEVASFLHLLCADAFATHVHERRNGSARGVARAWRHAIADLHRQQAQPGSVAATR